MYLTERKSRHKPPVATRRPVCWMLRIPEEQPQRLGQKKGQILFKMVHLHKTINHMSILVLIVTNTLCGSLKLLLYETTKFLPL